MVFFDYFTINYSSFFLMFILFLLLYRNTNVETNVRKCFSRLLYMSVSMFILDFFSKYAGSIPNSGAWCALITYIKYALKPALLCQVLMITERNKSYRSKVWMKIPLVLEWIVLAAGYPFRWIADYTGPDNLYVDGPLKPVTWIVLLIYMIIILVSAIKDHSSHAECFFLLIGESFIGINIIIELVLRKTVPGMELTVITLAILIYYLYFNSRVESKFRLEKEKELSQARMRAMISQIKPHFIYNSLACIAETCHKGSPEGEEAILTFSAYLRDCFQSLTEDGLIPFSDELRTIGHYLELEKLQSGVLLKTMFNIRVQNFRVPILSIETLVENAVKHGIRKKHGGGTVTIETDLTEQGFVVLIKDDGVGFDPQALSHDDSHLGLENAKMRLTEQCSATLNITSKIGIGTEIRIVIPEENRQ